MVAVTAALVAAARLHCWLGYPWPAFPPRGSRPGALATVPEVEAVPGLATVPDLATVPAEDPQFNLPREKCF